MFEHNGIWPLTPIYVLSSSIISILGKSARERESRAAVETCQLPFTFTEECWRVFTMLSVSTPDKSSQFINKIDGVAYHQFLLCVFPYKLLLSKASALSHQLISSLSPLPSPGTLRCFNIFPPSNYQTTLQQDSFCLCFAQVWIRMLQSSRTP